MITNATQLEVALKRLSTYQNMLKSLRADLSKENSSLFPLMSEGYTERIEALQEEIIAYLRERPAESALSIRLSGPSMQPGVIRATLVSSLIAGFQSALYQVGRLASSENGEGETQKLEGIRSILGLNLVATAPGSFVLAMDLVGRYQPSLFEQYDIASSTLERLINHVNELRVNPESYAGDRPTLRGLQKVASLVKKDVEAIEVVYRDEQRYAETVFDPIVKERIELLLGAPKEDERTVRGTLIEINVENNTCKVHPEGGHPVDVDYEEVLEDDLISSLKLEIEMAGSIVETGRPSGYRIVRIERFRVLDTEDDLD